MAKRERYYFQQFWLVLQEICIIAQLLTLLNIILYALYIYIFLESDHVQKLPCGFENLKLIKIQ